MKTSIFLTCLFVVLLTSCSGSPQGVETTPTMITVEVTRIVEITTTPMPTETHTAAPTLDQIDSGSAHSIETTPTVIPVEVTRIVEITTTLIPTATITPSPTLDRSDTMATVLAERIGTPIVASDECYETAQTQSDLNGCAGTRLGELQNQMAKLLTTIEAHYQQLFPEGLEKFQNFHAEWEDFSDRECMSRSGLDSDGWPGTMAPMNYAECMVSKYEDRLREYQIEIFGWTN